MLKAKNLRDESLQELSARLLEVKKELFELQNEKSRAKKQEKPHQLREKKKDIAKILTIIREKQMAES